jgi:glutaredoxin
VCSQNATFGRKWEFLGSGYSGSKPATRREEKLSMHTHETVMYSRQGCHLCDEAEQLLLAHGLRPTIVDIDEDPTLAKQFDTCVPVVEIDGKIRFRGRVDAMLLQRILHR